MLPDPYVQSGLFQDMQGAVVVGPYRYLLWRLWDETLPRVLWVMLNPSMADARVDDPTLRRVLSFSRAFGYGSLEVVNLFAFRSPGPNMLACVPDPIGPENDASILAAASRATMIIAGWGVTGGFLNRDRAVMSLVGRSMYCLGCTSDGSPRHPLYLRRDESLSRFI